MRSAALNGRERSRTAPQTPAEKIQSDESSLDPSQRFWQKPVGSWQTRLRRFLQKWALKHAGHGGVTFPRWLTTGSRVCPLAPHHLVSVQAVFFCPTIFFYYANKELVLEWSYNSVLRIQVCSVCSFSFVNCTQKLWNCFNNVGDFKFNVIPVALHAHWQMGYRWPHHLGICPCSRWSHRQTGGNAECREKLCQSFTPSCTSAIISSSSLPPSHSQSRARPRRARRRLYTRTPPPGLLLFILCGLEVFYRTKPQRATLVMAFFSCWGLAKGKACVAAGGMKKRAVVMRDAATAEQRVDHTQNQAGQCGWSWLAF